MPDELMSGSVSARRRNPFWGRVIAALISGFVAYVALTIYSIGTNDVFYGFLYDVLLPVVFLGLPPFIGVCFGRIFAATAVVYGGLAVWAFLLVNPGFGFMALGCGLLVSLTMSYLADVYSLWPEGAERVAV